MLALMWLNFLGTIQGLRPRNDSLWIDNEKVTSTDLRLVTIGQGLELLVAAKVAP